jgi:predicted kinase
VLFQPPHPSQNSIASPFSQGAITSLSGTGEILSVSQTPLTLMIGLPGSGKSTLAAQLAQESQQWVISTDQIREQLFGNEAIQGDWNLIQREVQRQFRQAIGAIRQGRLQGAIYDATNVRRRDRRRFLQQVRSIGFNSITGFWVDTPFALCLERNQNRSRQVPPEVILRMHRQLVGAPPSLEEGFDRLIQRIALMNQVKNQEIESFLINQN